MRVPHAGATARTSWSGVEVRHLAALVAVARTGSFKGAADALGYVQSAVSQQVSSLEQMVGHTLFDRERGARPTLTAAGERFLAHADEILVHLDRARIDLAEGGGPTASVLRIGTSESVGTRLLAAALSDLRDRAPAVRASIAEANDDELLELLRDDDVELAFVRGRALEPSFASLPLLADPTVLVVAAGSDARLDSAALVRHPMMPELEPQLRDAGIEPRYVVESEGVATSLGLVAAGLGSAIVPLIGVDAGNPRLAVHRLDDIFEPATLALVWMSERPLTPAGTAFRDTARRIAGRFADRPVLAAA